MPIAHPRTIPSPREGIAATSISSGVMQLASEAQTNKLNPRSARWAADFRYVGASPRYFNGPAGKVYDGLSAAPLPSAGQPSPGFNVWPAFCVTFTVIAIADASGACPRTVVRKHSAQAAPPNGAPTASDRSSIKGKAT
jgi:hypothetical protein